MRKGFLLILGAVLFFSIFLFFSIQAEVYSEKQESDLSPDSPASMKTDVDFSKSADMQELEFSIHYSGSAQWQGTNGVVGDGDLYPESKKGRAQRQYPSFGDTKI